MDACCLAGFVSPPVEQDVCSVAVNVVEADNGIELRPGWVILAKGGWHMRVDGRAVIEAGLADVIVPLEVTAAALARWI